MKRKVSKTTPAKSTAAPTAQLHEERSVESVANFTDNRPQAIAQRKFNESIQSSPRSQQINAYQTIINGSAPLQQMKSYQTIAHQPAQPIAQKKENIESNGLPESVAPVQQKENNTGLPDGLKTGVENLSGYSMDDVKVHYNSDKPAQLQAHAFAQGTDIHMAPGQEQHLGHEAWHIVQQKQGRVQPTVQMKGDVPVNDDEGLEKEADVMGAKANQFVFNSTETVAQRQVLGNSLVIQRNPAQAGTIAGGHSYQKHVVDQKEWGDPPMTRQAFTPIVAGVMNNPDSSKNLSGGRKAYWKGGVVVIYNPNAGDKGTCFKPNAGKSYYDNLT